MSIFTTPVN
jgi:hypothetical protein